MVTYTEESGRTTWNTVSPLRFAFTFSSSRTIVCAFRYYARNITLARGPQQQPNLRCTMPQKCRYDCRVRPSRYTNIQPRFDNSNDISLEPIRQIFRIFSLEFSTNIILKKKSLSSPFISGRFDMPLDGFTGHIMKSTSILV